MKHSQLRRFDDSDNTIYAIEHAMGGPISALRIPLEAAKKLRSHDSEWKVSEMGKFEDEFAFWQH